jgi:predicted short-subunit dehydrogenase-like oxidoreductase (DUF2520 family)
MLSANQHKLKIVVLGAGNVSFHITRALHSVGHTISQVIGKSGESSHELSLLVESTFANSVNEIDTNSDLYIIAVPDNQIENIVNSLPKLNGIVVHTSGSTPIDCLSKSSDKFGVLYPFQTFSKTREINLEGVPFCIEASADYVKATLFEIAQSIGGIAIEMDSDKRKWLHLTGVFSCNFVNHMLVIAQKVSESKGIDFDLIKPLIVETIAKALENDPRSSQTGPAIRGDSVTMKKHIEMLSEIDDDIMKLYNSISQSIWNFKQNNRT